MFKYKKVLKVLNHAAYLASAVMMMAGLFLTVTTRPVSAANSGAIWTTNGDCGDETQDVNHFNEGDNVHINGSGFDAGSYAWDITGQPGGASSDPGIVVASGNISVGDDGTFCIDAYIVQPGDDGEYSVKVGNKGDNYRVNAPPTATPTRTSTSTNTPGPTATNTATNTATATASNTPTNTATATATNTPTNTATNTATATATNTPTDTATPTETNTPTITPNTLYVLLLDPYCVSIPGDLMQWTVINNNAEPFSVLGWSLDGGPVQPGFVAPVGESLLTQTSLGVHTIALYWEQQGFTELTFGPLICQLPDTATPTPTNTSVPPTSTPVTETSTPIPTLPIPETGGAGGPIIPVTGADLTQPVNSWFFGGFGMLGFGLILSGLRKMYNL